MRNFVSNLILICLILLGFSSCVYFRPKPKQLPPKKAVVKQREPVKNTKDSIKNVVKKIDSVNIPKKTVIVKTDSVKIGKDSMKIKIIQPVKINLMYGTPNVN